MLNRHPSTPALRPMLRRALGTLAVGMLGVALAGCKPDAAWSPDGKTLVIDTRGVILSMDAVSHRFKTLSKGPLYHFNPTWSPDGKTLYLYRAQMRDEQVVKALELVRMDAATGAVSPLIRSVPLPKADKPFKQETLSALFFMQDTLTVAVSPDGKRLAYTAYRGEGPRIWTCNPDGTANRELLQPSRAAHLPVWSPDGSRLAYVSNEAGPPEAKDDPEGLTETLESCALDGSEHKVHYSGKGEARLAKLGPAPRWAADGSALHWIRDVPPPQKDALLPDEGELWSVPTAGGPARKLLTLPASSNFTTLNGAMLASLQLGKGQELPRLFLLDAPFTGSLRSIELAASLFEGEVGRPKEPVSLPIPAVSPDGKWVALTVVPKDGTGYLLLQPTDGSAGTRLKLPLPVLGTKPTASRKPLSRPASKGSRRAR